MDSSSLSARLGFARELAHSAGSLGKRHLQDRNALTTEVKGHQDFVSQADREVEDLIRSQLREHFPEDAFLGEEGGHHAGDGSATWVVDPIDGTTNFLHGFPLWTISIALVHDSKVQLGVIYDPSHDQLYSAQRGQGAFLGSRRLTVRDGHEPDRAVVGVGYNPKQGVAPFLSGMQNILETGFAFRRFGSAALGLAWVADGRLDGFWQLELHPWDVLAGLLLVEEAGGQACAFLDAGPLGTPQPTLASCPGVARQLSRCTSISLEA